MREAERSSNTDIYANVPNTLACYERASSGACALPPQSLDLAAPSYPAPTFSSLDPLLHRTSAAKTPVQDSADDYLTPSEHYYPRQETHDVDTGDVPSQYLTSPPSREQPMAPETQRLLSINSNSEPVEHGDDV